MEEITVQVGNSQSCPWMEEGTFTILIAKKQKTLSPPVLKIATERVVTQDQTCPHSSALPLLGTSPMLQGPPEGGPEPNAMTHGLFLRGISLGTSPAWQHQVCAMPNCCATAA